MIYGKPRLLGQIAILALAMTALCNIATAQRVISTFAGGDWLFPGDGKPAINAPLGTLSAVSLDLEGNPLIVDVLNCMVARIERNNNLTVLAGNGFCGFDTGQASPATSAAVYGRVAVSDSHANIFVIEKRQIRKISNGIITLYGGNGLAGASGDGGPASKALFCDLRGAAIDSADNLYLADACNNAIRRIAPDGTVTTVAGNGTAGSGGDGGPALSASLNNPVAVTVDPSGNLYIADAGNGSIRQVRNGIISKRLTFTADSVAARTTGALYLSAGNTIHRLDPTASVATLVGGNGNSGFSGDGGPALGASFASTVGLSTDRAGNILVADGNNGRLRRISTAGIVTTIAGNGNFRYAGESIPAIGAPLNEVYGVAAAPNGDIYFTEPVGNRVRKVSKGILTTVAGTGTASHTGDGGPAIRAGLSNPTALAIDRAGVIYVSDNGVIRKIDTAGNITQFSAAGATGFCFDAAGRLYGAVPPSVVRYDSTGNTTVIAGGKYGDTAGDDGPATSATMRYPAGIAFDSAGTLYIADEANSNVRKVTPQGIISTFVPFGSLNSFLPFGMAFDPTGTLYISGFGGIQKIAPTGATSVYLGGSVELLDGKSTAKGGLGDSRQMTFDAAGNLFVADDYNQRIRAVLATTPTMQTSQTSLTFSAPSAGAPATQSFVVQGSLAGLDFQVKPGVSGGGSWLSVDFQSGSTPRLVQVTADPERLSPGTYTGILTIVPDAATPAALTVNVTFTVGPVEPPALSLNKRNLSYTYPSGASATPVPIEISNTGSGVLKFTVTSVTTTGANWLSASPTSGTVSVAQPVPVLVRADPAALKPGTYTGSVTVQTDVGGSATVPVAMTISNLSQALLLTQTGMTFTAVAQSGITPPQTFGVVNVGVGSLPWSISTTTLSGNDWLKASTTSGISAAGEASPLVAVSVNAAGLAPGNYYGLVKVAANGAANSPQVVTAVLQVLQPGSDVGAIAQPSELQITGDSKDFVNGSPGSQIITLYNVSGTPLTYRTGISIDLKNSAGGLKELLVSPKDGILPANTPVSVIVQPIGNITGTLTFEFSDGRIQTVRITGIQRSLQPNLSRQGAAGPRAAESACTPTKLMPALTSLGSSFTVSAGWPVALSVEVIDDCGQPQVSGSVTATFTTGDPEVPLQSLHNGAWQATWPTRAIGRSPVTLTIKAVNEQLNISGVRQIDGALGSIKDPPAFTQDSIISAASAVSFQALSPGSIISIYGNRLAENADSAQAIPLPITLGNTRVIIADKVLPLFYASQTQVNAIVPFGLNTNTSHQLLVQRGLTYSQPIPVNVAPAQPAVFSANGSAIAFAYRGTAPAFLVSPANPAHQDDVLVVYADGLGLTDIPVNDGAASPGTGARTLENPAVSIGGQLSAVLFAGLVPGLVGLYQVNVAIPAGISPGDAVPLAITIAGQTSPISNIAVR